MTFEEFFKKKRIDLAAFEKGEASLFYEFKIHYDQMGEKSFDHTKKYWFNKLRRQFQLAPEIKTEKPHIDNQIAEQTITESLIATPAAVPAPKLGFVPKFKAGAVKTIPSAEPKVENEVTPSEEKPAEDASSKPAYKPRFNIKNVPPKTGE